MQNTETHFTSVPAFLSKLWALVDDPSTNDLIYWDETGHSFHVGDQMRFSKEMLPMYFKHNNISSFIRQLNMYGFRKVMASDSLSLKSEKEDLEFAHPCFVRGQEVLLEAIKRKTSSQSQSIPTMSRSDVSKIIGDISSLKIHIDSVTESLESLKLENDILWKEMIDLRQKHARQQELVSKLLQFFASIINNDRTPIKRKLPLMIRNSQAPSIQEATLKSAIKAETIQLPTELPDLGLNLFSPTPLWPNEAPLDTPNSNLFIKQEPKLVLNRDFSREEMSKNLDNFQDSLDSLYELLNNNNNQYNLDPPLLELNGLPDFVNDNTDHGVINDLNNNVSVNDTEVQAKRLKLNEPDLNEHINRSATGKELTHYIPPDEWLNHPQTSTENDKDSFSQYIFDEDI